MIKLFSSANKQHKTCRRHLLTMGLLLGLLLQSTSIWAYSFVSALDNRIKYVGRVTMASGKYVRMSYPGTQIHAVFSGTSLRMKMKPNSGYYMVEMDALPPFKVQCPEKDSVMCVSDSLAQGEHRATITFCTEGLLYKPQFFGFLFDDGCGLTSEPQLPARKIEFIGNSITCGFGIESHNPKDPFRYSTENQFYTYAAITARSLDAQCFVVARSGIGVYRNYGGKVTGTKGIMPDVYPYTVFGTSGEKWDFSKFTPDVVCVNLGTNDTSTPGYRSNLLYNGYWTFYKTLRQHYPDAKIVLLTGTMLSAGSKRLSDVQTALDKVRSEAAAQGDTEVYRFDMTPEDDSLGWGSCYHPSMERQAQMAEELTPYLREIMGW